MFVVYFGKEFLVAYIYKAQYVNTMRVCEDLKVPCTGIELFWNFTV
jgi:hypothetical protein